MKIGNYTVGDPIYVEQSLPICIILSALGGALEVGATALTGKLGCISFGSLLQFFTTHGYTMFLSLKFHCV